MDVRLVLAASAAINRFIAVVKIYVDKFKLPDATRDAVLVFIAVLAGIILALIVPTINIFGDIFALPPLAGQILTGVLAGLGADVLNAVIDLLYGWQPKPEPPAVVAPVSPDVHG